MNTPSLAVLTFFKDYLLTYELSLANKNIVLFFTNVRSTKGVEGGINCLTLFFIVTVSLYQAYF